MRKLKGIFLTVRSCSACKSDHNIVAHKVTRWKTVNGKHMTHKFRCPNNGVTVYVAAQEAKP